MSKKLRFKWFRKTDGTVLGKVKTILCKTQAGFDRQFTSSKRRLDEAKKEPQTKPVKPCLNTSMLAIYDREEK